MLSFRYFNMSQWMAVEQCLPIHSPVGTHGAIKVGDAWGSGGSRRSNAPATATSSGAPVPGELPVVKTTGDKPEGVITTEEGNPNPPVVSREFAPEFTLERSRWPCYSSLFPCWVQDSSFTG